MRARAAPVKTCEAGVSPGCTREVSRKMGRGAKAKERCPASDSHEGRPACMGVGVGVGVRVGVGWG